MNRAERRKRSANTLKRRRKLWSSHFSLGKNPLTGQIEYPIENFTFLKTTGKPCSKYCCGNPRKHFKQRTVQEEKADQRFKEEIIDVGEVKETAA